MKPRPKNPSELAYKLLLRMPEGMRERIAGAARATGRSMNAEIISRLEVSFGVGDPDLPDVAGRMKALALTTVEASGEMARLIDTLLRSPAPRGRRAK